MKGMTMLQGSRRFAAVLFTCVCVLGLFAYARGQGGGPLQPSVTNAEKLVSALAVYLRDWDEQFPPMKTQAAFQSALKDYAAPSAFICPFTNQPYLPNAALSRRSYSAVRDEGTTPAVSAAIPGGAPLVAYLDGHVQQGKVDLTDPTAETAQYAKRVSLAVLEYAQDYDEYFPIAKTSNQVGQALAPYVRDNRALTCPLSHKLFRINPQLIGAFLGNVDLVTTPMTWDTPAQPNNQSVVSYIDDYIGPYVERGGVDLSDPIPEGQARIGTLITALNEYAQSDNGVMPPTQNPAVFKQAVYPSVQSDRAFISPFSQQPYTPNPAISGKPIHQLGDLSRVIGVEDPVPASDGKIMIGYLDGYITRGGVDLGDRTDETVDHAGQLMHALQLYLQDHNEALPPMATFAQFKTALFPYVQNSRAFTCPYNNTVFRINTALNGHNFSDFSSDPSAVVVLQDPKPERGGLRTVGYLDGHVTRN